MPLPPTSDPAGPLVGFGWSERWATRAAAATGDREGVRPGRVVRHDGLTVTVATAEGVAPLPVLAAVEPRPVVGDWVLADDAVCATLERTSLLRRRDPMRDAEQPIAANVDIVVIVCGLDRPVKPGRLQRATALARDAGADPLVALTKADLAADPDGARDEVEAGNPGVEVVVTASATGRGIAALQEACRDRTVVLIGESGAGKSSLANALAGVDVAAVGAVRAGDAKGRHTTTSRQLHVLPSGGVLIDTPGIRAVGLWGDVDAIAGAFEDVEGLAGACRFSDCAHTGEPGCAVEAAVVAGHLARARLDAWHALQDEAAEAEERAEARAWRAGEGRRPTPARRPRRG
ncbi:MAG TPA: ribosome small subunit-dependent GTPase A [Acidimicrobiales bacterium]|nr:ribosome small subunit-dependent GTPase A [Acidimicrobiales bacterium]